jgi:pimeloyl-ACP methyl ester carboxylesterase/DNA-binding CsgD family transcriptional regulator
VEPRVAFVTSADGTRIAWTSVGVGPALVSLPGVPFSNLEAEWRIPVLRRAFGRLAESVRLIQHDGRGSGRSQRDVTDVGLDAHLADIDAVVGATGVSDVVLLGFYNSTMHAIAWAARHPERVRGLILFGGAIQGGDHMRDPGTQALLSLIDRDWNTFVESATHAWLGWPDEDEGRLAADWFRTSTSPGVARATLQAAFEVDVTAEAATVRCPVLVLHRRDATVVPLVVSEALTAAMPRGRLELVPGSSASLYFEATDVVVDRIKAFVREPEAPAAAHAVAGPAAMIGIAGGLSPREREVLALVAAGESNGQIAARLGISINTVERHVSNLYRKIDVRGRAEATAWAVRRGLA